MRHAPLVEDDYVVVETLGVAVLRRSASRLYARHLWLRWEAKYDQAFWRDLVAVMGGEAQAVRYTHIMGKLRDKLIKRHFAGVEADAGGLAVNALLRRHKLLL